MKLLNKEFLITIKKSFKRYLSILIISLLGVGFFAGIRATSPDMKITADKYYDENNFYDIKLISTWGIDNKDIDRLKDLGVEAEGSNSIDIIVKTKEEEVVKVLSYDGKSNINKPVLVTGRLPKTDNECVIETNQYTSYHKLGDKILLEDNNFKTKELTIVGTVKSPIYISLERGSTKLLSGKVNYYMYVPIGNFNTDYFTEANIIIKNNLNTFDSDYQELIDEKVKNLETIFDKVTLEKYNDLIKEKTDEINTKENDAKKEKDIALSEISNAKKEIVLAKEKYSAGVEELKNKKSDLDSFIKKGKEALDNLSLQLNDINTNITNTLLLIEKIENTTNDPDQLQSANNNLLLLNQSKTILESTISNKTLEYNSKVNEYKEEKEKYSNLLDSSLNEINIKEKEIKNNEIYINDKFNDIFIQINNSKEDIKNIEKPTTYVLDRTSNLGYYQYKADTDRITNIGKVFPMVFFIVAVLICLTSMTRMIEEERNQLGTLKSLGYTGGQILLKYIMYALSATLIGSIIGLLIGFNLLPTVIFKMYNMMYNFGDIIVKFNIKYALIGTLTASLCTLIATLSVGISSLKEAPASLMRPKAPKSGKRVLLERVKFIWKRLKFIKKVTVRNVFRYKKRFLMTIIGIGGCTGLIIAGFGLKDCITGMVPSQYNDVFKYELSVTFKDDLKDSEKEEAYNKIKELSKVKETLKVHEESITLNNYKTNQTIQLVVPFGNIDDFISLKDRQTKEKFELKDKLIISEKLSKLLNIKTSDHLDFNINNNNYNLEVSNIAENYIYHYVYMNKSNLKDDSYNTLFIRANINNEKDEKALSNELNKIYGISGITFTSAKQNIFSKAMSSFSYVVWVLIVSAGLLAFVVLYNLASVNISERKRELATIKVLGFNDKEVYDYINRETVILSILGMLFGIFIGKFLTFYIIKTCELDMIMFNPTVKIISYIYSIAITIIFTLLVNITTYFALKKVDMIESLKSVE